MTDKELFEKLDLNDRLQNRGFVKIPCKKCKGLGFFELLRKCFSCDGKGYFWQSPITK
mgnify:CR=1 FL=1